MEFFLRVKFEIELLTYLCHWPLSIPPENIRKFMVFLCFQGVLKESSGMKWVKSVNHSVSKYLSGIKL